MDIDSFQEEIGGLSKYQIVIILATVWLTIAGSIHTLSAVFLSAVPDHRCAVPPLDDSVYYNLTEDEILNYTIPWDEENREYESCIRYDYNLTNCSGGDDFSCLTPTENVGTISCDKGYHYDRSVYTETTISEWDLVCDRRYLDTLANTLFFFGLFMGSLFVGPLSDWFGRKITMLILCTGLLLTGIGCAFVPSYELYVFVRVLIGGFSITAHITVFIYVNEISSKRWRTETTAFVFVGGGIAHSLTPGFAYIFRDWRQLEFFVSLLLLPFYIIYIFIPESPRWLISQERFDEAKIILERYARSKGTVMKEETWNSIVETEIQKKKDVKTKKKQKIWDLFRRPVMRFLSCNVLFCWFTVSMVFYGLSLNGGNLSGDPYLNNALLALVEIGSSICVYFAGPLGRIPVLCGGYLISGILCISSMLFKIFSNGEQGFETASTALAVAGKFFASMAFTVIYAVTAEIYPTQVRSTAVSMGSMAARVGSMLSPLILQIQYSLPWFTQTVFGSLSILAGLACLAFPETTGISYLSSLDDAEDFYKKNIRILKWCQKRKDINSEATAVYNIVFEEESNNTLATKL